MLIHTGSKWTLNRIEAPKIKKRSRQTKHNQVSISRAITIPSVNFSASFVPNALQFNRQVTFKRSNTRERTRRAKNKKVLIFCTRETIKSQTCNRSPIIRFDVTFSYFHVNIVDATQSITVADNICSKKKETRTL